MTFFDTDRIARRAEGNIASGPAASFVDQLSAAYEESRLLDTSIGEFNALYDVYDEEIDRLSRLDPAARRQLFNPATGDLPARLIDEPTRRGLARSFETHATLFSEEAARLGFDSVPGQDEMRERAIALAARRVAESAAVRARAASESGIARFLGSGAAILTDPPVLGSMAFGASASAGILRTALVEAAVAGGTELAIQPLIAESRESLGLELTIDEAINNVLLATAGGGLFGGAIKATGVGFRAAAPAFQDMADRIRSAGGDSTALLDAGAYLERAESLSGMSPYTMASIEAQAAHIDRLDEAMIAGREGRAADIPTSTPVPVRADILDTVPGRVVSADLPGAGRAGKAGDLGGLMRELVIETAKAENAIAKAREASELALEQAEPNVRDIEELADLLRNPSRIPTPKRLATFLQQTGGLRDLQGELTTGLGIRPKTRPGLINNRTGQTLDDAALAAQEAGFFPTRSLEEGDRVTTDELLTALDEDLRGKPVVREADFDDAALNDQLRELERALDAADLDISEIAPGGAAAALDARAAELAESNRAGAGVNIDRSEIEFRRLEASQEELDRAAETEFLRSLESDAADFEFEMDDGEILTGRQIVDEFAEYQQALDEFAACVLAAGREAA